MSVELLNCDCMEYMRGCGDGVFDLVIVDPPYFEVKGGFDFKWATFEEYLADVETWAKELRRVLSDSGSLFWWGHAKKIAYSQILLDRHFTLINSIVWEKTVCQTKAQDFDAARSFAPVTERVLYYGSLEHDLTGLQFVEKEYIAPRNPFAKELIRARIEKGVTIKEVAEHGKFYGNVNHGGSVTNWERGYNVPLQEQWQILCEYLPTLRREYEELRREYEELRREYEELRRPFINNLRLTDVLKFDQESNITRQHKHPTQKAPKLTRALVDTTGKKGGRAFVPFMGSGTEVVELANFGMDVAACEIDTDYYNAACVRVDRETKQLAMF